MYQFAFDEGTEIAAVVHARVAAKERSLSRDRHWLRAQAMPMIEARLPRGCPSGRIGLLRAIALCGVYVGWQLLESRNGA
jgi:hypothetical protein